MAALTEMRDGSTTTDPRLGRLRDFDERSRSFAVAAHPMGQVPIASIVWPPPAALDQGPDGTCVGHGCEGEAGAMPVATKASHEHALVWFDRAAAIDPFPGVDRRNGTTVLAGGKVGVALGFWTEYRWCFTQMEIYSALQSGPVIVGTDWLDGMWDPDADGRLHIEGSPQGGHCWLIYGLILKGDINPLTGLPAVEDTYLMQNSWGQSWGRNGRAWLYAGDFESIRVAGGEVMVPVGRKDPYLPAPAPKPSKPVIKYRWIWNRFRGWIRVQVRSLGCRRGHAA